MIITEYLQPLSLGQSNQPYSGGVIKLYYTFIEWLNGFPAIHPKTQRLLQQPNLLPGRKWFGPIDLPNPSISFTETSTSSKAGIYYKMKAVAALPGSNMDVHNNLFNLSLHQFCVVAKHRSGNYWVVYGNDKVGCDFSFESDTGKGGRELNINQVMFTYEGASRGFVLPEFEGEGSEPPFMDGTLRYEPLFKYVESQNGALDNE